MTNRRYRTAMAVLWLAAAGCGGQSVDETGAPAEEAVITVIGWPPHPWVGKTINIIPDAFSRGDCFDVAGGVAAPGTPINHFPCHFGPDQQFIVDVAPGSNNVFEILRSAQNPGLCVDVTAGSTASGTPLQLFPCHGATTTANNQWFALPRPTVFTTPPTIATIHIPFDDELVDFNGTGVPIAITQLALLPDGRCPATGACKQFLFRDMQTGNLL